MKAGNEEVGPKIDLQLGLNYSNQCILKTGGLGAGANAVSKLGMRFVANSPLSELVWSPGKGLSLKYVDSRDDEEIQESVESCCNSSGQFSTGKRLNFQQDLMVGNKRFRKQTQEVSSNSLVKQDSSFMNWICLTNLSVGTSHCGTRARRL